MDICRFTKMIRLTLLLLLLLLGSGASVYADEPLPEIFEEVRFDQRLGESLPLDLTFRDETGRSLKLEEYFGDKPVILTLNYYDCDNLCSLVLEGLVTSLHELPFTIGKEFEVITLSIDPREPPEFAGVAKAKYLRQYNRPEAESGWHFLTGEEEAIKRLAGAVGFHYSYDEKSHQFAHPSGVVLLTPEGQIARYAYGVDFSPRDLRLGLVEASQNKIGSPVDQLLLFCYRYDPDEGKYEAVAVNSMRLGGLATVLVIGAFLVRMGREERRQRRDDNQGAAE